MLTFYKNNKILNRICFIIFTILAILVFLTNITHLYLHSPSWGFLQTPTFNLVIAILIMAAYGPYFFQKALVAIKKKNLIGLAT